jgi:hypothetical protein
VTVSVPPLPTRVGLALVAPARAFQLADDADGRAGLGDVATLLFLKFVATEAKAIVVALWTMVSVGILPGLGALGPRVLAAIGLDLLLVFGGGLVVTVLAGRGRRPSRDFDLASTAWIPYFTVTVLATLVLALTGWRPRALPGLVLGYAALGVYAVWIGLAIRHARARKAS